MNNVETKKMNPWLVRIGGAVIALIFLIYGSCSVNIVNVGHRGVRVKFGNVQPESLPEGLYFVEPFSTKIVEMDARILSARYSVEAYTKDVQQADVAFVINYRLDPAQAPAILKDVGQDWSEKLVIQVLEEDIKREFGQHNAVDIIADRDKAARSIEANVKKMLLARRVILSNFQLTNFDFTDAFEHSVEQKVIAQQKAIEEKNRTEQVKEKATQVIETARGAADAMLLKKKAEADGIEMVGRALANNPRLIEYQTIIEWNGELPATMVAGSNGALPLINIPVK